MVGSQVPARSAFSVQLAQPAIFDAVLDVRADAGSTEVTISAENAESLNEAYITLNYDASRFSPAQVEIGGLLGSGDEVIHLALTDLAGSVPIGMAQVKSAGVTPASGSGVLATVRFDNKPFEASRSVSGAPTGTPNIVDDLIATPNGTSNATLRWTEKNTGDYDNNSEVGITDLSPLATMIFQSVDETADPIWASMLDGDKNGEINTADIVPIASNFGTSLTGYQIYTDSSGTTELASGGFVPRPSPVESNRPVEYSVEISFAEGSAPEFTVRPVGNDDSVGVLSVSAPMVVITDPPLPPTALAAVSGQNFGNGVIHLDWEESTSDYLTKYEIQRKLSTEDDTAWTTVIEVGKDSIQYNDSNDLEDLSYDYRIFSWNAGDLRSETPKPGSHSQPVVPASAQSAN